METTGGCAGWAHEAGCRGGWRRRGVSGSTPRSWPPARRTSFDRVLSWRQSFAVLAGGGALVVGHPDTVEDKKEMELDALQLLPGRAQRRGMRPRSFANAASLVTTPEQAGWKVQGPRTTEWLVKELAAQNTTPLARHFWWRSVQNLSAGDPGVDEHQFLSELIEHGLMYDGLNLGDVMAYEAISRRYQLWEEAYSASLRESETGAAGAGDWLDERHLFCPPIWRSGCPTGSRRSQRCSKSAARPERSASWRAAWAATQAQAAGRAAKGAGARAPRRGGVDAPVLLLVQRGRSSPGRPRFFQGRLRAAVGAAAMVSLRSDGAWPRDILPLPVGDPLDAALGRRRHLGQPGVTAEGLPADIERDRWLEQGVLALNALGGGGRPLKFDSILSQGQRDACTGWRRRTTARRLRIETPRLRRGSRCRDWELAMGVNP